MLDVYIYYTYRLPFCNFSKRHRNECEWIMKFRSADVINCKCCLLCAQLFLAIAAAVPAAVTGGHNWSNDWSHYNISCSLLMKMKPIIEWRPRRQLKIRKLRKLIPELLGLLGPLGLLAEHWLKMQPIIKWNQLLNEGWRIWIMKK